MKSSYESIRGTIISNWERKNGKLNIHIEVPYGITCSFIYDDKEIIVDKELNISI